MTIESILQFFFKYNAVLIETLIVLVLLLASFLTYRGFKQAKDEAMPNRGSAGGTDFTQLEESLKKILEKANTVPTPSVVGSSAGSSEASAALIQEIDSLKKELQKKQIEIEEVKNQAQNATSSGISAAEKTELETKISDLQNKLSEFDIISQDIADLTMYRDENVKLKKEIEDLKVSGGLGQASAAVPEPAVTAEPATELTPSEPIVASAVEPESIAPEPGPESPAPASLEPTPEPVVAEPEPSAVAAPEVVVEPPSASEQAPVAAESAPAAGATTQPVSVDNMDDLFNPTGDFSAPAAADTPTVAIAPSSAESAVAEPSAVKEPETTTNVTASTSSQATPPPAQTTASTDAPDPNNVVDDDLMKEFAAALAQQESGGIPKPSEPVVTSQDKELMGQFENFVNKDGKG